MTVTHYISRFTSRSGQATVEFVVLVPVILFVALLVWQCAVAGHAWSLATASARSAARAEAVGSDPKVAAKRALTPELERGLKVKAKDNGETSVTVRVPCVVACKKLLSITAKASFEGQQ